MTKREAFERYCQRIAKARRASFYQSIVRRWLEADGRVTDEGLTAYAKQLEAAGMRPNSIRTHLSAIKSFCRANNFPWSCSWRPASPVQPRRIAFSEETVAALINAAISYPNVISKRDRTWLLLSTLYGCRATELSSWTKRMLRPPSAILIRRAKGSISRWYWCPPALAPIFASHPFPLARHAQVYQALHRLWAAAGLDLLPPGAGWHAIRRCLVVGLQTRGVADMHIQRFLGWRPRNTTTHMVRVYGSPNLWVTRKGIVKSVVPNIDLRAADGAVWDRHPFLQVWLRAIGDSRNA